MPKHPRGNSPSQAKKPARRPTADFAAYIESRGSAFVAVVTIIAGQAWLVGRLALQPVWLLPTVSALLLIVSVLVYRSDLDEPSLTMRWISRAVVVELALANAALLGLVVRGIFVKSPLDPFGLLLAGLALWTVNIAVFALAYWEIDAGGPEDRASSRDTLPDLVFPQQTPDQDKLAPADWAPGFLDYLYVSLTASTAFSPTDAMPYTRTAKVLMAVESTISFAIVIMLVARAVNIAKG